jgi:uncharacterized phiE125 gp8 family phage protein
MNINNTTILSRGEQQIITLDQVKHYLRLDANDSDEDKILHSMMAASVLMAEKYLGFCLSTQEVEQITVDFCGSSIPLKYWPIIKLEKVFLRNEDKSKKDLEKDLYFLNERHKQVELVVPFISKAIGVHYYAGYEDASIIPEPIKLGILNHISSMYDNRHLSSLPQASLILYAPYRNIRLN